MYVKAFVLETTDKACPGSWENSWPPGALLKIIAWGQLEASGPLCSRKRQRTTAPASSYRPGQECCSFFHLILPESQSPHRTLFIPWYKTLAWKEKTRWFVTVWTHSEITGHLNKAPIKIQWLSLLIGFGSDRQPELPCLFWFHFYQVLLHFIILPLLSLRNLNHYW